MSVDEVLALYGVTWNEAPDPLRRLAAREAVARDILDSMAWNEDAENLARCLDLVACDALRRHPANSLYLERAQATGLPVDPLPAERKEPSVVRRAR